MIQKLYYPSCYSEAVGITLKATSVAIQGKIPTNWWGRGENFLSSIAQKIPISF